MAELKELSVATGDKPLVDRRQALLSHPRRVLFMIGALSVFGPLCIDMYLPALPKITRALHASASSVQFSLTACFVGIGLGQLLIGPLSDRYGRRRPLLCGLSAFVIASAACAFSPGVYGLIGFRLLQGLGGAAGIVIARAIVRDLFSGLAAARFFSVLMLITGLGPILAPQIGAGLLKVTSWRGIFLALALAGGAICAIAAFALPETRAADSPQHGLGATLHEMRGVISNPVFLGNALALGLGMGGVFCYVSASSFVLENIYGLSPQLFGLVFAMNACGMIAASQINARLVSRIRPSRLMTFGLSIETTAGVLVLVIVSTHVVGLAGLLPVLFLLVSSLGFFAPNATAIALNNFPRAAGTASALMGLMQFSVGAFVAPLMGVAGNHSALRFGIAVALLAGCALGIRPLLARHGDQAPQQSFTALPEIL